MRRIATFGGRWGNKQRLQQVNLLRIAPLPTPSSATISPSKQASNLHPRTHHVSSSNSHGSDGGSDTWDDWQCDADADSNCPSLLPPFEDIVPVAIAMQQAADALSFNVKEAAQLGGVKDIYGWISFVNWCRRSLEGGACPKCGSKQDGNLVNHMCSCQDMVGTDPTHNSVTL